MRVYDKEAFCCTMLINEALFGQSKSQLEMMMREVDTTLDFDFKNFYLCLTGLKKKTYQSRLNMNRIQFRQIFLPLLDTMDALASKHQLKVLHAVLNYDGSKQVVFLIQPNPQTTISVYEYAQFIMQHLENQYMEQTIYAQSRLANFTVLSNQITDYESMAKEFEEVRQTSKLSFFKMEAVVMQTGQVIKKEVDWKILNEKIANIENLIFEKDLRRLQLAIHDCVMVDLKKSFDFNACYSVLNDFRKMVIQLADQFFLKNGKELAEKLKLEHFACIEEMEEVLRAMLSDFQQLASKSAGKLSPTTINAIAWIKENAHRDIGLQEVAEHVQLSSAYLSRTFSKELNIPISAYINRLRMERAKTLLLKSDEKISTIAAKVGIENSEYFSVLFKKNTGMRPQEYRQMYKE